MGESEVPVGALRRSTDTLVNVGLAGAVFLAVVVEAWLRPPDRVPAATDDESERHHEFEELLSDEPWEVLGGPNWPAVLLIATIAAGCILAQRRWPTAAVLVMGVTAAASVVWVHVSFAVAVAFGLTLYTLATERGWLAGGIAGMASIGVAGAIAAGSDREGEGLVVLAYAVVIVLVPLLAAANTRSRRAYLAEVQARLRQAQAEQSAVAARAVADERVRLARDLHDVLAHSLTVVNLQVGVAAHLVADHPDRARRALDEAREAGAAAIGELRTTLALMRGDEPESMAPVPGLGDIASLVASMRATGLRVEFEMNVDPDSGVGESVGLVAYRVVQEGLTNVVRHAGVQAQATVEIAVEADRLVVIVADTGGAPMPSAGSGLGLTGLAERCRRLGGEFTSEHLPTGGFRIRAVLPTSPVTSDGQEEASG
ncbi:MAG: hypothetical protein H6525_03570 [Actinobacteria bacterium]|nr:hypothetical protein [Actinomycetota bacterium]